MLTIEFSKSAEQFLRKLPPKQGRQLAKKLRDMQAAPHPNDSKLLRGQSFYRSASAGEYRIIYYVSSDASTLVVDLIGKRNDDEVYKKLRRK